MLPMNHLRILLIASVIAGHTAYAQQDRGTMVIDDTQRLAYTLGAAEPVIELTYTGGFIDSEDRNRITVHAEELPDGTRYEVEVYRPAYMKEAGLFRSELSVQEFQSLMRSFGAEAVLGVSPDALQQAVNAEFVPSLTPDTSVGGSHGAQIQIDLRIANELVGTPEPDLRSLSVPSESLQSVARGAATAPRDIASGVLTLEGLVRSKKLERVE